MIEPHLKPIQQKILGSLDDTSDIEIASYNDVYKSPLVAPEEYSFKESYMAGYRQLSGGPSLMRMIDNSSFTEDPEYDPLADKQVPEGYEWRFLNSSSAEETSVRLERLEQDLLDMDIIQNGNLLGVGLGGLTSPLTFAPLGTFKILSQTSFLKRFVGSAAFTTAIYAPEEFLIASQSEGRTELAHTLIPLLGAGLIGGTVGGLFGRRMSKSNNFAE